MARYPWDQLDNEPVEWWSHCLHYCALGPRRSVEKARDSVQALQTLEQQAARSAPVAGADAAAGQPSLAAWRRMARRYGWRARARAWDAWLAQRLMTPLDHMEAIEQRERDLLVRRLISDAIRILDAAALGQTEAEAARALVPQAVGLLRAALAGQRITVQQRRAAALAGRLPTNRAEGEGSADDAGDAGDSAWLQSMQRAVENLLHLAEAGLLPLGKPGEPTATELLALLDARRPPAAAPRTAAPPAASPPAGSPPEVQLLVVTGADRATERDLAMVRAVARETGLHYAHIEAATAAAFEAHLQRARGLGRPIPWVHLACHVGEEGVRFADRVADGAWLSSVLAGVQVLLIAGCNSDRVGDWLPVVPHVLTLSNRVTHENAAAFTRHFWGALAADPQNPTAALNEAVNHCGAALWEHIVAHW